MGVPEIIPSLKIRPAGRSGVIDHESGLPPVFVGVGLSEIGVFLTKIQLSLA